MPVVCKICDKIYSTQYNLNKHCRLKHDIKSQVYSYAENIFNFKCLDCKCSFPKSIQLIEHLRNEHNQTILEETLEFQKLEEFESWKNDIEQKELCNYVIFSGTKTLSLNEEVKYFICNRSENRKNRMANRKNIVNRKRNTKKQGSAKINHYCISKITLRTEKTKFVAHRVINHYGHTNDVQHLRISHLDKQELALKLADGVSRNQILDDTRNKISTNLKRIDLLTRQDLYNLKMTYNIPLNEEVKHTNDTVNVELWVEECKSLEVNPVLFYKAQGQPYENFENSDFCLIVMNDIQESILKDFGSNIIVIDSTHDLNNYDFEMTTLMIVDEFNQGFPVALMFSNRKDTYINYVFFMAVKQKVGAINCRLFMSDINDIFYNVWEEVMGESCYQLYCPWHVDRAWCSHLNNIFNKDKKVWVYKTIKYLQKHTDFTDVDTFQEQLQTAIDNMLDDSDIKAFGEYFSKYYSENYLKWAYYFHQNYGINTNMRLESMHKVIKYFYLGGKSVKRLDKGLYATFKYVRDKIVDRLIKHTKGKPNNNRQENFKNHRLALTLFFNIREESPETWVVNSDNHQYQIQKTSTLQKCSNFICQYCDICIHQYSCTCPNHYINGVICKHIHFVVLNNRNNITISLSHSELTSNTEILIKEEPVICQCLSFFNENSYNSSVSSCDQKEKILKEISELQMLVHHRDFNELNDTVFQQLISNLHAAKNLLNLPST